jgi:hypothetical protein
VTGAAQLIELPERVGAAAVAPTAVIPPPAPKQRLFAGIADDVLLGYGVPPEWLDQVRGADEDSLLDVAGHLPQEAAVALLDLATGTTPERPPVAPIPAHPFAHPDASAVSAFWPMSRNWSGRSIPLEEMGRLSASGAAPVGAALVQWAGAHLGFGGHRQDDRGTAPRRRPGAAFSGRAGPADHVLEAAGQRAKLRVRLRYLVGNEAGIAERIAVHPLTGIGYELYASAFGQPNLAPPALVDVLLHQAAAEVEGHRFPPRFLAGEWRDVVDA